MTERRKGARRMAEIEPDVLAALSRGEIEAASLVECLAVDMAELMSHAFPDAGASCVSALREASDEGYTRRMALSAELLLESLGPASIARVASHRSDTVRGWAGYMIGMRPRVSMATRMKQVRPLADDPNSGVREWAWLGVRGRIIEELDEAIAIFEAWTGERSANLRRFATEATRPRGVWCTHINALKEDPRPALPLLEPLRADPTKYVQDSVANWLNDASKTAPDWVRSLTSRWRRESPGKATDRICRRALRTIGE